MGRMNDDLSALGSLEGNDDDDDDDDDDMEENEKEGDLSALGKREARREGCLLTDPPCRRLLLA